MSGLRLVGIRKSFGATRALANVSLAVAPGEVHALIGENGAGKSTLMKILSGAHRPDAGAMELDGAPYAPEGPHDARRKGVTMIYQELNLALHLSAQENILLGLESARWGWIDGGASRARARAALAQLGYGDLPLERPAGVFAEQQIIEIARALLGRPRVLILDEPTSSLTQADAEKLFTVVRRLREQGVSVIYISHFLEECRRVADRFTVLKDGETVADGPMAGTGLDAIVTLMTGREVSELYPRVAARAGAPVLQVRGAAGGSRLREASLELRAGEILGLAGLIGAGRTDLVRTIFALDELAAGEVCVGLVSGARQRAASRRWIEALAIKCRDAGQPVGHLSGGNQQKVALARLLEHPARIFLLDEPTLGIDVGSKAQIYRIIGELAAAGKAVLIVSSYLPELLGLCDRIGVMCRGRLAAVRPRGEWTEEEIMRRATGGS